LSKLIALISLAVLAATAGDPPPQPQPEQTEKQPVIIEMLRIKDPVTGELRKPTSDEIRLLMPVNPLERSDKGLVQQRQKDGSVKVDLQGGFQSAVMAKVGPDGKVVTGCVKSDAEARAFVEGKPSKKEESHDM
jgi:hypothetical protein